jgi:MacB-like periplasmic core domain
VNCGDVSDQTDVLRGTLRDTRHSLRRLMRDWPFTTAAVLILALGIGANTAIFSIINAVLFRHASLPESDRLVDIYQRSADADGQDFKSYPAYLDMAGYTDVFASTMAASVPHGGTYQHEGTLRTAVVEKTTATYLSVLGLRPSLGRWFSPGRTRAAHRSWPYWAIAPGGAGSGRIRP